MLQRIYVECAFQFGLPATFPFLHHHVRCALSSRGGFCAEVEALKLQKSTVS